MIFFERKQPDLFNSKNDFLNYYVDTIKKIKEISEIYSFQFIQVLQPHVFFKKNKSIEEKSFTRYNYRNNFINTSYSYIFKKLEDLFYESNSVFIDGRTPYIDINKRIFSDDVHFFDETGYEILIDTIVKEVN